MYCDKIFIDCEPKKNQHSEASHIYSCLKSCGGYEIVIAVTQWNPMNSCNQMREWNWILFRNSDPLSVLFYLIFWYLPNKVGCNFRGCNVVEGFSSHNHPSQSAGDGTNLEGVICKTKQFSRIMLISKPKCTGERIAIRSSLKSI